MSKPATGLLREMIGAYISRPEPFSWLAAADLLEEQGHEEEARLWRNRGRFYPMILDAFEAARMGHDHSLHFGTFSIDFIRKPKTVKVVFSFDNSPYVGHFEFWYIQPADPKRYATRNIIRLIDLYGHRMNAETSEVAR